MDNNPKLRTRLFSTGSGALAGEGPGKGTLGTWSPNCRALWGPKKSPQIDGVFGDLTKQVPKWRRPFGDLVPDWRLWDWQSLVGLSSCKFAFVCIWFFALIPIQNFGQQINMLANLKDCARRKQGTQTCNYDTSTTN